MKQIETTARTKLADMRAALADESNRRELFLALFPDGLKFAADRTPDGKRQVWRITGDIDLGSLIDATGSKRIATRTPANDGDGANAGGSNPAKETGHSLEGVPGSKRIVTPKGHYASWTGKYLVDLEVTPTNPGKQGESERFSLASNSVANPSLNRRRFRADDFCVAFSERVGLLEPLAETSEKRLGTSKRLRARSCCARSPGVDEVQD